MDVNKTLRGIGVLGVIATYGIYSMYNGQLELYSFLSAGVFILALIAPETIDDLPWSFGNNNK